VPAAGLDVLDVATDSVASVDELVVGAAVTAAVAGAA
jgi:hypothetical protein